MSLSNTAKKIFDHLPQDGTKIGGITLQRELNLSKLEYQKARDELKGEGLVIAGQGRGGSLGRVEGKEPEVEHEVTKVERMAHAREAKVAMSRVKREAAEEMEKILIFIHAEGFPRVEAKDVSFSEGRPVFAAWEANGKRAKMYGVPQLDYDKLRARQR